MGSQKGDSSTPEAMGRLLIKIREHLGVETMDCLWIFPPMVRGRKEWGLVAVSLHAEEPDQRSVVTARYTAELSGSGLSFESELTPEGAAPAERLPRVMDGVVRRSELRLGDPRVVKIGGSSDEFSALLGEYPSDSLSRGP
jgi:hypothetical protein